ncbi:nuclease-related domain-containing protein [Streptomyces sp. NPDC051445]|uniref:nuclease-related domain-containing protein n=1 Tax=Streptomyces sp. NPDC051445 TaxID=3365653 RepID=UPI0037A7FACD
MGAQLNRLERHSWRVLHSIPLADKVDVDHLLIGPDGVFSITDLQSVVSAGLTVHDRTVRTAGHLLRGPGSRGHSVANGVQQLRCLRTSIDTQR